MDLLKDPTTAFDFFKDKLARKEPFAFSRFSDGELFMMQGKEVQLAENHYITGDIRGPGRYTSEEFKHFRPAEHQYYQERLIDCLRSMHPNYFKGICTRSDVSQEDFDFQTLEVCYGIVDDLTFANVFINANYPRYIAEIVPLFADYPIVLIANEKCQFKGFPSALVPKEFFPIGNNCMIDSYGVQDEVKKFMADKKGWLVLSSAATLSNYIIDTCFPANDNNTYLDIGSSLNPIMGLEGWKYSRGYLQEYWLGMPNRFGRQVDVW